MPGLKFFIDIVISIMIISGCSGNGMNVNESAGGSLTKADDNNKTGVDDAITTKTVPLTFTTVPQPSLPPVQLESSSIVEKRKLDFDLIAYVKEKNAIELYFGQKLNGEVSELGEIGEQIYVNEISTAKIQVLGKPLVIVSGLCGSQCVKSYGLTEEKGVLKVDFSLDEAIDVVDLNNDGINELLGMQGTLVEIQVYKKTDDQLMSANINKVLGSQSGVMFNKETKTFETILDNHTLKYRYSPSEDSLIPVK